MPKKSSSGWKGQSGRKPLSEISTNATAPAKSSNLRKKISSSSEAEKAEDKSPDRLLLVHSQLSDLIHQIDELVVQACKLRPTSKIGCQETESFTHVLSEMHSSLQPWVQRLQQALSTPESHNLLQQPLMSETVSAATEEKNDVANIAIEHELDSLISPSPLVSWRGGCKIETGRQLFLLTPLPKSRVLSSRQPALSRSVLEKAPDLDAPCHTLSLSPLSTFSEISHDLLVEQVELKSMLDNSKSVKGPGKSKSVVEGPGKLKSVVEGPEKSTSVVEGTEKSTSFLGAETTVDRCVSPPEILNHNSRDHSMYLMTPLLKMSPPKTCMLLEPIPEPFQQQNNCIPKLSQLAVRLRTCDDSSISENSSCQVSDCLASKYEELLGVQLSRKPGVGREETETSLDWFLSPPKTCILMETPNEKLPNNPVSIDLPSTDSERDVKSRNPVCGEEKEVCGGYQSIKKSYDHGLSGANLSAPRCTPMWKEIESTVRKGKQPGENTLKRELWTKFDAVSTNVLRFDVSPFKDEESKGFLDRLEEVSCEETGSETKV